MLDVSKTYTIQMKKKQNLLNHCKCYQIFKIQQNNENSLKSIQFVLNLQNPNRCCQTIQILRIPKSIVIKFIK